MDKCGAFSSLFSFDRTKALFIGMERECFLARKGVIVPEAYRMLKYLGDGSGKGSFGYELSACQFEDRVGPCLIDHLGREIEKNETVLAVAEKGLELERLFCEVAPVDMPLDVYPDPTGRYRSITEKMSKEILLAACRVAGIHFHVGMPDQETALRVYNQVIGYHGELCTDGDRSRGERLSLYGMMAKSSAPVAYRDWFSFYEYAEESGFADDPRRCWHLIRISIHGTIEFRMFGSTADRLLIDRWARKCHGLCQQALSGS
jgi:gamma-glutamyl:cysteine ligase YbdK (ATP-grasp superfamily)